LRISQSTGHISATTAAKDGAAEYDGFRHGFGKFDF
jgi:hypothetical protein